ncbi:DUF2268 domain-containing protein [Roseomonas stagni]|uniref:DUF2268 domain-containing protein n=1 Tax=Falsiroseomonas algicola TaxID=2716930 RepID=A0A6M1LTP8_9PROT|nr:DUF2268 domain-containing putative Zn-dependent protease [Falsiroseomonas algicola]NGM22954.1 DUF2268 domain-containing protein [Falsiroseomonas algicola]
MAWTLHWLTAAGDLGDWRLAIEREVEAAKAAVAGVLPLRPLDILVQRVKGAVIPEIGMVGQAYRKDLCSVTLDPENAAFSDALATGALCRTVVHEVNHCLRMGGPGYGRTLGEALVSEGLAGHFTARLCRNPPEPWECAVPPEVLRAHRPDDAMLADPGYDHASWFFGRGGQRPRWLGYTMGYAIVAEWLAATPAADARALVDVPAAEVLAAAWPT